MTRGVNCVGLIYRIEPRGGGVVTRYYYTEVEDGG